MLKRNQGDQPMKLSFLAERNFWLSVTVIAIVAVLVF